MTMLRPGGHVEVFHDSGREKNMLVHSSRPDEFLRKPCVVCGEQLGFKDPVVLAFGNHIHQRCMKGSTRG